MIRSVEPGRGSSMVMLAPESPRILRIRAPPLPIIAPANWNPPKNHKKVVLKMCLLKIFFFFKFPMEKNSKRNAQQLTSFGMETWVVSVWPRSSSRKIRSSWYILKCARGGRERERNELQAANDGRIEIYDGTHTRQVHHGRAGRHPSATAVASHVHNCRPCSDAWAARGDAVRHEPKSESSAPFRDPEDRPDCACHHRHLRHPCQPARHLRRNRRTPGRTTRHNCTDCTGQLVPSLATKISK